MIIDVHPAKSFSYNLTNTNMTKYGILREDSKSDFDSTKKAEYYDEIGLFVADEANKHLLHKPKKINHSSEVIDKQQE